MVGIELVTDRKEKTPAKAETGVLFEKLKGLYNHLMNVKVIEKRCIYTNNTLASGCRSWCSSRERWLTWKCFQNKASHVFQQGRCRFPSWCIGLFYFKVVRILLSFKPKNTDYYNVEESKWCFIPLILFFTKSSVFRLWFSFFTLTSNISLFLNIIKFMSNYLLIESLVWVNGDQPFSTWMRETVKGKLMRKKSALKHCCKTMVRGQTIFYHFLTLWWGDLQNATPWYLKKWPI